MAGKAWGSGLWQLCGTWGRLLSWLDQETELNQPEEEMGTVLRGLKTSAKPHVSKVLWLARTAP